MWQDRWRPCAVFTETSEGFAPYYLAGIRHDIRQTTPSKRVRESSRLRHDELRRESILASRRIALRCASSSAGVCFLATRLARCWTRRVTMAGDTRYSALHIGHTALARRPRNPSYNALFSTISDFRSKKDPQEGRCDRTP